MAISNVGYAFPTKSNLSPGVPPTGVIPLTTTAAVVLAPPATEAPRWVTSGARLVNTTEVDRLVTFHYVPTGGSAATANIMSIYKVLGEDTILLGEFPLITGYSVYAKVDAVASSVNLFLPFEEVE